MTSNETVTMVVELERRRRGLTRQQLAELLGHSSGWMSKKLNGDLRWSMDDLDLVSERLGIPLPVLLMPPPLMARATQRWRTFVVWATRRYHTQSRRASVVSV